MVEQVNTTERLNELFAQLPLKAKDIVWLVGGCEGLQIRFLLDTYPGIRVNVYEPQPTYVEFLRAKFRDDPVTVYPYAVGDKSGSFTVGLQDTECTFHWKHLMDAGLIGQPTKTLPMEDIIDEYLMNPDSPKLLMMNCEGSELEIIKRLSEYEYIKNIPYILIQFHSRVLGFEGCQEAYDILSWTHDIKWRYNEWAWVYAEVKT